MDPIAYRGTIRPAQDSRLTHAAVRVGEVVHVGWRHANIMHSIEPRTHVDQDQQGFVDQYGVFYGRYQAARVAAHARQIVRMPHTLLSEMLWGENGEPLAHPWGIDERAPLRPAPPVKTGRNAPCPCKSGKKFKKCCGK